MRQAPKSPTEMDTVGRNNTEFETHPYKELRIFKDHSLHQLVVYTTAECPLCSFFQEWYNLDLRRIFEDIEGLVDHLLMCETCVCRM